jgi:spermidine/putrescine transport system permease protein
MKSFRNMTYPYIVWLALFVVAPMLMIVFYAFTNAGNDMLVFKFTLENFTRFFQDPDFLRVLYTSLKIAFITTVICVLIGYPTAYVIAKQDENKQAVYILLLTLPMWINMLVRTYAWKGILMNFDISSEFKVFVGMVYNFLPYMIIQIYTSLAKMDKNLLDASYDLGANKMQTFLRVVLPLSIPGVISGITLVFLPAVSSFFIPKLLGGGDYVLIGNLIETYFITTGDWNFGSAISLIMAIIIIVSMYFTKKIDKRIGEE